MSGRNGNDALNRFLIVVALVLFLLSTIFSKSLGQVLYPLFFILLIFTYYRMFSRNLYKRQRENAWYYQQRSRFLTNLQ